MREWPEGRGGLRVCLSVCVFLSACVVWVSACLSVYFPLTCVHTRVQKRWKCVSSKLTVMYTYIYGKVETERKVAVFCEEEHVYTRFIYTHTHTLKRHGRRFVHTLYLYTPCGDSYIRFIFTRTLKRHITHTLKRHITHTLTSHTLSSGTHFIFTMTRTLHTL